MMRFSIRTLLGVTFVIALGLLAWQTANGVREAEARIEVIKTEITPLEARVRLDDPTLHQVILNTRDQYESLFAMRDRAVEHFDALGDKYSAVEPRGDDVLSLRTVPSFQIDGEYKPVVFRVLVPEEREVWLKCGVHPVKRSGSSSREPELESDLARESPFDQSGPFEMKLAPGIHTLTTRTRGAEDGLLPISVALDGEVLLQTSFEAPDVTGAGPTHVSGRSQIDWPRSRPLPWLITVGVNLDGSNQSETSFGLSVWLSAQSSDFSDFPGDVGKTADVSKE